jgi:hypothetical protein
MCGAWKTKKAGEWLYGLALWLGPWLWGQDSGKELGSSNSVALCGPTLGQVGKSSKTSNIPQVSTPDICEAACAPASPACLQRGRVRDALLAGSPKLLHSLCRPSGVSCLPVPGFCSPRARTVSHFSSNANLSSPLPEALATLTPPGSWVGAGPTAEPPPTASQAGRTGGLLGCLHLLFLKRRGADRRHHWSSGPSHQHTARPALLRTRSSSGARGDHSGRVPAR